MKPAHVCTGKREYPDFVEARKAAKRTNNSRDTARVQPYRCVLCACWHVGLGAPVVLRKPRPVEIADDAPAARTKRGTHAA